MRRRGRWGAEVIVGGQISGLLPILLQCNSVAKPVFGRPKGRVSTIDPPCLINHTASRTRLDFKDDIDFRFEISLDEKPELVQRQPFPISAAACNWAIVKYGRRLTAPRAVRRCARVRGRSRTMCQSARAFRAFDRWSETNRFSACERGCGAPTSYLPPPPFTRLNLMCFISQPLNLIVNVAPFYLRTAALPCKRPSRRGTDLTALVSSRHLQYTLVPSGCASVTTTRTFFYRGMSLSASRISNLVIICPEFFSNIGWSSCRSR
jgi:hypothetical protein